MTGISIEGWLMIRNERLKISNERYNNELEKLKLRNKYEIKDFAKKFELISKAFHI
jgi:hypothetical protein